MVFVTGATGLVGSHLLYRLLAKGYAVLALKRPASRIDVVKNVFCQYPGGEELWSRVEWVDGDVLESGWMATYIRKSTCVYHCAAIVSFSSADQRLLLETNLQGTENIASLCLEYGVRLCYVSSIAALGDARQPDETIDEDTPVIEGREHSVYSQSKAAAEKIIWRYIGCGLNAVLVCPSVILGAGMWDRSSARLYMTAARGIPFYTKGITGYVDVRDVCELMIRLSGDLTIRGERFILNGGNYSYQELFTVIAHANGKRRPCFYLRPWLTGLIWRMAAVAGKLTGRKPAFTRETARSAHHCSLYSSNKLLSRYPDFHFHTLQETVEEIHQVWSTGRGSRQ